jgi:hypothetical protein
VTVFALRHLDERQKSGDRPATVEQRATAMMQVNSAVTEANKKIAIADRPQIAALAQTVLTGLQ